MKFLFLALFVISGAIHLYASYNKNTKLRARSKGFILPALLGWYICSVPAPSGIVIAAILTSWLGDVLLIPNGTKWFVAGGISFMVSHACFVLAYLPQVDFGRIPVWAVLLTAAVYFTAVYFVFQGLKPYLKKALYYPMFLYLLINGTMNAFALFQLISMPCAATAIAYIGAVLFFISDSTLFYVRFKKDTVLKKTYFIVKVSQIMLETHFVVMLTYIIAEFLIVQGLVMIALM